MGGAKESGPSDQDKNISIRAEILGKLKGQKTFSQKHVSPIVAHINEISSDKKFRNKPIIVIGHSYGGDSAYKAVKKIKYPKCACVFLITVDPVSRMKSTSQGKVPYPGNVWFWWNVAQPANFINVLNNVQIGDNIAAKTIGLAATVFGSALTLIGSFSFLAGGLILKGYGWVEGQFGNTIAVLGGQWNLNTEANINIAAKYEDGDTIPHGSAMAMMKVKISDEIGMNIEQSISDMDLMKCKDIRAKIDNGWKL